MPQVNNSKVKGKGINEFLMYMSLSLYYRVHVTTSLHSSYSHLYSTSDGESSMFTGELSNCVLDFHTYIAGLIM